MKILIVISFIVIMLQGCTEPFSPNGKYVPKLIVYAVLDASIDTQYVRVLSTYDPREYNPNSPAPNREITNASVVLKQGAVSYSLHDTILTFKGANGLVQQYRAYVHYGVRLQKEAKINLTVTAPGFDQVTAFTECLIPGEVYPSNSGLFIKAEAAKTIPINVTMGLNARAYLMAMYLEYEYLQGGTWVTVFSEVPSSLKRNADGEVTEKIYPSVAFRSSGTGQIGRDETVHYESPAYKLAIQEIRDKHQNTTVRFRWVHLDLQQFDTELYSYYSVTNKFPGSSTLRLDEPDYTNISNGYGIFGNITRMRHSYFLPPDL